MSFSSATLSELNPLTSLLARLRLRRGSAEAAARPHRRVRVPTILQMEAVECGAASLAMILAHHGRIVPLEELRVECGVSRDGSKASNIIKAARRYGLDAKGLKREPKSLPTLAAPMVVHWNFNHFLVLEGFRNGRAFLNDPASGPRQVSSEEFDQSFTGVVLTFQPGEAFVRGGQAPSLVQSLGRRLEGSYAGLLFVVLAGLALLIPGLLVPTFSQVFVDSILVQGMHDRVRPLLLAMGATAAMLGALTWLQQQYLLRMEGKLALSTSARFFWHVIRLPFGFFTQRYSGEIGSRVAINDRIATLLSNQLATNALNVVLIVFYAALMIQYDVVLTVLGVVVALLNLGALQYVSRRRVDLNQRLLQDRGKLLGTAMGGLQTIETLKATGSESDFFARWSGYQAKVINAQQQLSFQTQLLSAIPPLLLSLATALTLGIGGYRVMDGHLSMGMLIAFQALMLAFLTPINRLIDLGSIAQEVRGDMTRLDDVLDCPHDPRIGAAEAASPAGARADAARLTGAIELRDVSFGYSPLEPPLIEGFSLSLRPGSRVALVGGSGCGKSTVSKLITGLYEPWTGEVLFDGRPRGDIRRGVLTQSLAVVDQEIFLFEGTIRENLSLWDGMVSEADMMHAARDARIHDEITGRPGGYLSPVEEGGRNFSGGQRQRMEIARALVGNPSILVLDEATSALDPATEMHIDDHVRRRGCTCVIIAHRLSTIRDCDEIIVMERGKIVQRGTHEELKSVAGHYRQLVEAE
jgi:NHLM bacteriocin system ABC transporter peptidase/ATP-binding protein